ncbi:MAG: ATP synthase F1 subunit gamma [Thermodesulfobacteriota bacterium]
MPTLKDVKRKIGAVKKTQQITKAMNMVAAAKLRGAQGKMENFRPYASKFAEVIGSLSAHLNVEAAPLLEQREVKNVDVLLITADRGLCGSFNINLINTAEKFLKAKAAEGLGTSLVCLGRKGRDYFRRRPVNMRAAHVDVMGRFDMSNAITIAQDLAGNFLGRAVDEVYVICAQFISMAVQRPITKKLLPISPEELGGEETAAGAAREYLYEPSPEQLITSLLPTHVNVQVYNAMLETAASEHAARMRAMDNAQRNCKDLINSLTLMYNKARQAGITKELMDIVGGAEALKK